MRTVATADTPSSSSAAGSRTQAACRIELRFIALGALESKGGVATPGPSIRPARFFGKEKCRLLHPATDTDSDLPPPGITRVSLNREHYYASPNPLAVSASKNGRNSFGHSRPRRRFPSAASGHYAPTGLGRIVFLLDEWRAHGHTPDSRRC